MKILPSPPPSCQPFAQQALLHIDPTKTGGTRSCAQSRPNIAVIPFFVGMCICNVDVQHGATEAKMQDGVKPYVTLALKGSVCHKKTGLESGLN